MPAAFAELQGDFLYMLTTPSREEMEQMIEDFGKKLNLYMLKALQLILKRFCHILFFVNFLIFKNYF